MLPTEPSQRPPHQEPRRQWLHRIGWLLLLGWLLLQLPSFLQQADQGQMPIDYLAYYQAAQRLAQGESPYLTQAESLAIWRYFHQNEVDVITAQAAAGRGQAVLAEQTQRPQQPGPYVYPPTLARLLNFFHLGPWSFVVLLLLSVAGFSWLWLHATQASGVWLLLVIFSVDVLASLQGGNVELLLLWATLAVGWLLWQGRVLPAVPLLVFVLLTKPFYGLCFVALAALQVASDPQGFRTHLRSWIVAALATLVLGAIEVWAWGGALQAETWQFLRAALDYQWFVLPVAEQTPMSLWNRTPMQGLINAGIAPTTAQYLALALWLLLLGVTLGAICRRRLGFPLAFALALVLLYWGRPVGWVFAYLELVVVVTVWPHLGRWPRRVLLVATVALMLSHWVALVRTLLGYGMPLVTVQTLALPWETWLVLPLCWLVLLYSVRKGSHKLSESDNDGAWSGSSIRPV